MTCSTALAFSCASATGAYPAGANKASVMAGDKILLILFFLNICFPLKVIYVLPPQ
jgi:hypothetical protein